MITVDIEGIDGVQWTDLWSRHIAYGECEGWVGASLVICLTRPFTPDEDLLFDWVLKQDSCELFGIHHMEDGRDLIVFDRTFSRQTRVEAQAEHQAHIRNVLVKKAGIKALAFG